MGNLRFIGRAGVLDHVQMIRAARLFLCLLLGVLLGGVAVFAHAETIPATTQSVPVGSRYTVQSAFYYTPETACAAVAATQGPTYTATSFTVDDGGVTCVINGWLNMRSSKVEYCATGTLNTSLQPHTCGTETVCPSGQSWTLSGSSCTRPDCPSGFDRASNGQCVKDCTSKAGQPTVNGSYSFGPMAISERSVGGCKVACKQNTQSGVGGNGYQCSFTGASASPNNPEAEALPPDPTKIPPEKPEDCLAKGMGYIAGSTAITCVPSVDAPPGQKPTIEESKTEETGKTGTDGKADPGAEDYKKTDTTTKNEGGKVTTTTKETVNGKTGENGGVTCPEGFTLNGDGVSCSKSTTTTKNDTDFCLQNPNSAICKTPEKEEEEGSTWGGTCAAGFVCTGDAATCAIAKASYETRCTFSPDETTALHDANNPGGTAEQVAAGVSALNSDGSKDFNIASEFQAKSQSYINYSSSCPVGSQSYTIGRATFTLDGEMVCSIGVFVRLLIHILAYMALIRLFSSKLV